MKEPSAWSASTTAIIAATRRHSQGVNAALARRHQGVRFALSGETLIAALRSCATGAQADDRKVGKACSVAEPALYQLTSSVKLRRGHGSVVRATLAREVLTLARHGKRVQPGPVPEVDVSNETDVLKGMQVAVHRGDVRRGHAATDPLRDLLGRHRPVGREECRDHQPARGRDAQAVLTHQRYRG